MSDIFIYLMIGLAGGVASGLLGIGGAVIMIPALVLICGFSQQSAQGTSLALMLPPIGLLAAMEYFRKGHVDIRAAGIICLAFFVGGYIGARGAESIPTPVLRKGFACFLVVIAVKMFFTK